MRQPRSLRVQEKKHNDLINRAEGLWSSRYGDHLDAIVQLARQSPEWLPSRLRFPNEAATAFGDEFIDFLQPLQVPPITNVSTLTQWAEECPNRYGLGLAAAACHIRVPYNGGLPPLGAVCMAAAVEYAAAAMERRAWSGHELLVGDAILDPDGMSAVATPTYTAVQRHQFICNALLDTAHAAGQLRLVYLAEGSFHPPAEMTKSQQGGYLVASHALLNWSEAQQIPVVFISRQNPQFDLARLAFATAEDPPQYLLPDSEIVPMLLEGNMRTLLLPVPSEVKEIPSQETAVAQKLLFAYVKARENGPIFRLEMPRWIVECGLGLEVMDTVVAACIRGNGWPCVLDTAETQSREMWEALAPGWDGHSSSPF